MEYKLSTFNNRLIVNGHTLIYNSLTGKLVVVKNIELTSWDVLETMALKNSTLGKNLNEAGILINNNVNEIEILEERIREGMSNVDEFFLHINPTLDCNFQCWYCYENHLPSSIMEEEQLQSTMNLISKLVHKKEIKRLVLGFFGGEPLLHFDKVAKRLIQYAGDLCKELNKSLYISFTTNGFLLTNENIAWLSQYSCGMQITLDGGKTHHDKTRFCKGGAGSFDKIVNNIKNLVKEGIKVIVRINFTTRNISSVEEILDSFVDLSPENKKYVSFDFQRVWQDRESSNDKAEREASKIRTQFSNQGFKVLTNYLPQDVRTPCYGDKVNHALINYNGDVFGCTARDFNPLNRIGILERNGDISYDIEKYLHWRASKFSKDICKTCRIAPLCGGGCMQKAYEQRNLPECTLGYSEEDKDNLIINLLDYIISNTQPALNTISL